jgi:DNA-directed RNA polymerase subunit RPC12/RpoP
MGASLRCLDCGRQFKGLARYKAVGGPEREYLRWVPTINSTAGLRCASCGSNRIRLVGRRARLLGRT